MARNRWWYRQLPGEDGDNEVANRPTLYPICDIDGYETNEGVHCRIEQETRRTSIGTGKEGPQIGGRTVNWTLPPKDTPTNTRDRWFRNL